jgi:hypothetical protein
MYTWLIQFYYSIALVSKIQLRVVNFKMALRSAIYVTIIFTKDCSLCSIT